VAFLVCGAVRHSGFRLAEILSLVGSMTLLVLKANNVARD
jgi:hypothetical protein